MMTVTRPTLYSLPLIGWKEHVALPLLGAGQLVAKIDTGARVAALHAEDISIHGRKVRFTLVLSDHNRHCEAKLVDVKRIKSSNGSIEKRPVIETDIQIGMHRFSALITLTDRKDMGVPMLLGREVLKGRFLVNPSRTFLLKPKKAHS
jgi:hypothetical protein